MIGRPGAVIIRDSVVTEAAVVVCAVCKKHVIRISGFSTLQLLYNYSLLSVET